MSSLREEYATLDLKVLEKVDLSDKDWALLERAISDPRDENFTDGLPIIVAQFKQAAAEEIMAWAQKQSDSVKISQTASDASIPHLSDYQDDVLKIDRLFFKQGMYHVEATYEIGNFSRCRSSHLHADGIVSKRMYLSRLGGLPTLFLRREKLKSLPFLQRQYIQHLINLACKYRDDNPDDGFNLSKTKIRGKAAKQKLISMGMLEELPLGSVGLMVTRHDKDDNGTLHCSTELPKRADGKIVRIPSAFLRMWVS